MADLITIPSGSPTIKDLMANLERVKYNPSSIQRVIYEYLDEVTDGVVNVVDPSNPFVFLLESSAVSTAAAVTECVSNLRKMYPSLAVTQDDLYYHMTDADYLNRFATPTEATMTLVILASDIQNKMAYDDVGKCHRATIPRDTQFVVDGLVFTMQYPIDIRRFETGLVQMSYDATVQSPLNSLNANIITPEIRTDASGISWLFFPIKVVQYEIKTTFVTMQKSTVFNQSLPYGDQYYYCRVFYRNARTSGRWAEIKTTHSDQVFDPLEATAVLKVYDGILNVSIPPIYLNSGLVSGEARIDVYTTRGKLAVNLSNYNVDAFKTKLTIIDQIRDTNEYSTAMGRLSFYGYSSDVITGGTDGVDFDTLRKQVVYNSLGKSQIPITNRQLESYIADTGFNLVKNVDAITNRIFLATRKLPKPINTKLLTAANIGTSSVVFNIDHLKSRELARDNGDRVTLMSKTLFKQVNGVTSILDTVEVNRILSLGGPALVQEVNTHNYLYTPFYYVFDNSSDEFQVRPYNLDYPSSSGLNFVFQNETLQLPVNTGNHSLSKTNYGYELRIITKSGNFYKQLQNALVGVQIGFTPVGESRMAYINGTFMGVTGDDERIFSFEIRTNHDLNAEDQLCITNAKMFANEDIKTWCDLSTIFTVFHTTSDITTGYVRSAMDDLFGSFLMPKNSAVVTQESINLALGSSLKYLWCRSRSYVSGQDYRVYDKDEPLYYQQDVFEKDPTTGSIFTFDAQGEIAYNQLHRLGDPVLDKDNNQVYKHRKGDVVLDKTGDPVLVSELSIDKSVDFLFVDARHYFVNSAAYVAYNAEFIATLDTWVTSSLNEIQNILLEKTKIFYYPNSNFGKTAVIVKDRGADTIPCEQSFSVDLYVSDAVYLSTEVRGQLVTKTIQILDDYISGTTINLTEIGNALMASYGTSVKSYEITGMGGEKNYRVLTLTNQENRLSLAKALVAQQDGSLILKEDVAVNFYRV